MKKDLCMVVAVAIAAAFALAAVADGHNRWRPQ